MKKSTSALFALLLTFCLPIISMAQNAPETKIVRGKADTVFAGIHYITGTTERGSTVFINNLPVKLYSTGSFGAQIELTEGNNLVELRVVKGSDVYTENFNVFFKKPISAVSQDLSGEYPNLVVKTKSGAYLNYGAGEDRLGGAKINFLAEGIKLEVLDSINNLYKVKLSSGRYSYIPKNFTERLIPGTNPAKSLTGSWSVVNSGMEDKIRVSLQQRLPYTIYREIEPNRIVIDIHGAECNSNWITQYLDLKAVDYVHFNQTASDVFTVIIKLKDRFNWGYTVDYSGTTLDINIKHAPQSLGLSKRALLKGLVIGVDAGHGGTANGAVSTSGIKEKDLNLAMAYMLKNELEKRGATVVMSRSEDIDVTMQERIDIFKKGAVNLVVSIHCNAGGNPLKPMGTSTYYRHIDHRPIAVNVLKRLLEMNVNNFGLIGNFNFALNAPTEFPSVLVETMFMSSLPDEEQIADQAFQREMMIKVVKGLEDFIKEITTGK